MKLLLPLSTVHVSSVSSWRRSYRVCGGALALGEEGTWPPRPGFVDPDMPGEAHGGDRGFRPEFSDRINSTLGLLSVTRAVLLIAFSVGRRGASSAVRPRPGDCPRTDADANSEGRPATRVASYRPLVVCIANLFVAPLLASLSICLSISTRLYSVSVMVG